MTRITQIVRWLTRWAWATEIRQVEGIALVEEMHAVPGMMELTLKRSPAQREWICKCFASLLVGSQNYT